MIDRSLDHRPPRFSFVRNILALVIVAAVSRLLVGCASPEGDVPTQPEDVPVSTAAQQSPTEASSPTPIPPTPTPLPPTPTPEPTPCTGDVCTYPGHFVLDRPIAPEHVDVIDPTYRYGSTQGGERKTHHGVEFVNPQGTPVLAAADGRVIVAGLDNQVPYADFPLFYGNLVIIAHDLPGQDQPVFTLYGHLYEVQVEVDQQVEAGDQIGLVGFTGAAIGEHLHFEVRVGENSYRETRNPVLWLQPHTDADGQPHGAIAGRILNQYGNPVYIPTLTIERINPGEEAIYYLESYADWTVNGDDVWGENFALADLPAGTYRVSFVASGLQTYQVDVLPGHVTVITFQAGG
jgi:murein DD-endopeptidase MepM/ murein hydrolase activator NlpD